jgi:hypothetical protein
VEGAVDAEADAGVVLAGLDVDVGGAELVGELGDRLEHEFGFDIEEPLSEGGEVAGFEDVLVLGHGVAVEEAVPAKLGTKTYSTL